MKDGFVLEAIAQQADSAKKYAVNRVGEILQSIGSLGKVSASANYHRYTKSPRGVQIRDYSAHRPLRLRPYE
jgi:hypothetical protein